MKNQRVVSRLLNLMRPLWGIMSASVVARIINQLAGIALPAIGVWGIIRAVENGTAGLLLPLFGLLAGVAAIKGLFRYLEQFTGHYVAFRLLALLRHKFYTRIVPLAPAGVSDLRSGDLSARFSADVDRIEPFYAHTIAPAASAILVPGAALIYLANIHLTLAGALIPFLLGIGVGIPFWVTRRQQGVAEEIRRRSGEVNAHITDSFQGLRDVLVFGYGARRRQEIHHRGERLAALQQRQYALQARQEIGRAHGWCSAGQSRCRNSL